MTLNPEFHDKLMDAHRKELARTTRKIADEFEIAVTNLRRLADEVEKPDKNTQFVVGEIVRETTGGGAQANLYLRGLVSEMVAMTVSAGKSSQEGQ